MSAKLDQIRKLLATAESLEGTPAAETYRNRALELMARHGLDDAIVEAARRRAGEAEQARPVPRSFRIHAPYSRGKADLLTWIGAPLGLQNVMHHGRRRGEIVSVTLFGFPADLDRAELLYTSLLLQAATALSTARPDDTAFGPEPSRNGTAAYRRSWLRAFAARVAERLEEMNARAVAETEDTPGAALVLADRDALVRAAYITHFGNVRTAKLTQTSTVGYADGYAAGERADLGSTGIGQSARRALEA